MSDRKPFRERPHVIDQWCTCRWLITPATPATDERRDIDKRDPDCPLHGDHAKEAPF